MLRAPVVSGFCTGQSRYGFHWTRLPQSDNRALVVVGHPVGLLRQQKWVVWTSVLWLCTQPQAHTGWGDFQGEDQGHIFLRKSQFCFIRGHAISAVHTVPCSVEHKWNPALIPGQLQDLTHSPSSFCSEECVVADLSLGVCAWHGRSWEHLLS